MIRRVVAAASCIAVIGVTGPLLVRALAQDGPRLETASVAALKWRSIGPANTGGRIDDFAVARVPGPPTPSTSPPRAAACSRARTRACRGRRSSTASTR